MSQSSVAIFKPAKIHVVVGRHDIKSRTVLGGKLDHVIGRVPLCRYIAGHDAGLETHGFKDLVPLRKNKGG